MRERLRALIEHPRFQQAIIALIVINAITLGLETNDALMASHGALLHTIDQGILVIFVIEIVLRLTAFRLAFFRDPWSLFDLFVVIIALLPASGPLSVLRALRVLRVFRLINQVPSMRRVVAGLLAAIPGLSSVFAVMGLVFYVASVIATKLFGDSFPEWFGSIGASAYTLFQVMTLESWSMGIARPVIAEYPYAWMFFIPFILVATFTLLNLFIGVIVSAIQEQQSAETQALEAHVVEHIDQEKAELAGELKALRSELAELRAMLRSSLRTT